MKKYFELLRIKHYIKNILIFIPAFFGEAVFEKNSVLKGCLGFLTFSMLSSVVYIINDYRDIEKDRKHPVKKNRPMASGTVTGRQAFYFAAVLIVLTLICSVYIGKLSAFFCLLLYLFLNVLYSMGLKNKPIVDVVILASGFVIRVFYGGIITGVSISKWLYLVVVTGSLYMGLGKRRNELKARTDTREVLMLYNESFLDKNMYVFVALINVFYALWTIELPDSRMIWTVPFFIVILMCYSLDVEGDSDGDPVEVIVHDKALMGITLGYAMCVFALLYVF